jgi:hypothetical protein
MDPRGFSRAVSLPQVFAAEKVRGDVAMCRRNLFCPREAISKSLVETVQSAKPSPIRQLAKKTIRSESVFGYVRHRVSEVGRIRGPTPCHKGWLCVIQFSAASSRLASCMGTKSPSAVFQMSSNC